MMAEITQPGTLLLFLRTEVPLIWLLTRFLAVRGQESRYCPPNPVKVVIVSALAAPESGASGITHVPAIIAAAVSTKTSFVQGVTPETKYIKLASGT
ncbi:hypothetical protein ASF12_20295 [Paenibacillus sp. Leaf72]|nr:hypothetical protein ASF12_20295 [Paenibacillus sp. Leaf72]